MMHKLYTGVVRANWSQLEFDKLQTVESIFNFSGSSSITSSLTILNNTVFTSDHYWFIETMVSWDLIKSLYIDTIQNMAQLKLHSAKIQENSSGKNFYRDCWLSSTQLFIVCPMHIHHTWFGSATKKCTSKPPQLVILYKQG